MKPKQTCPVPKYVLPCDIHKVQPIGRLVVIKNNDGSTKPTFWSLHGDYDRLCVSEMAVYSDSPCADAHNLTAGKAPSTNSQNSSHLLLRPSERCLHAEFTSQATPAVCPTAPSPLCSSFRGHSRYNFHNPGVSEANENYRQRF